MSDTPETDAAVIASGGDWSPVLRAVSQRLERERDEARAVACDLASVASHCLGWHDHESGEAAERIDHTLKRWKSAGKFGNPTN